ncbi:polyketide synthase dehydratase domain-containing protein [Streptomyces sp. M10(2022)]
MPGHADHDIGTRHHMAGPVAPTGAQPLDIDVLYARLADLGYTYGPAFQGVRAAWRDEDSVYAEVVLRAEEANTAPGFGIHPALFDAALHGGLDWIDAGDGSVRLPFSWSGCISVGLPRLPSECGSARSVIPSCAWKWSRRMANS